MKIKEKIEGKVAILSLSGNMMGGPETQEVHEIRPALGHTLSSMLLCLGTYYFYIWTSGILS